MRWKWAKPDLQCKYPQPLTYTSLSCFFHIYTHWHINTCTDKSFPYMLWYYISFTLKLNAYRCTSSVHRGVPHYMMLHRSLVCIPSGLTACVSVCMWSSYIYFLNFSHPTVYMHSRFTFQCHFMFMCVREMFYLSHIPPCMSQFLCICVWLQIAECFDVHVCTSYMKYNAYLCLGVLCGVSSPLCVCVGLSEPLTGLLWIRQIIFSTLWLSKYWDIIYITYITKTKILPVQNKCGFFASAILVCLHTTQLHNV